MRLSDKPLLNYSQRLRRLRYLAIGFLLFLLIPLGTLLYFGFQQIKNNLLIEYQREASNLVQLANRSLYKRRMLTNTLSVDVFDYYQQVYNPVTRQLQQVLSPLSQLDLVQPVAWLETEGLVGYFQYNANGDFNSPIWPYSFSSSALSNSELSENAPAEDDADKTRQHHQAQNLEAELGSELFERKKKALKIYQIMSQSKSIQQIIQQEFIVDKQLLNIANDVPDYLIFYRLVSVSGERRLQGYLVERKPHLSQVFTYIIEQGRFESPMLVKLKDLENPGLESYFFYQNSADGQIIVTEPTEVDEIDKRFQQQAIYDTRLFWPYDSYSIVLSTNSLPMTPAMVYSGIFMIILIVAILFACYGFYRLGVKQLVLAEQRLNFVSSVSHELKTPLTSIQMYSQMLKEGTIISSTHQQKYFEFIYSESERLTRLINNILQLSTLSNQQQNVQPEYTPLPVLVDIIRSKTSSIIEKHNFQQNMMMEITDAEDMLVLVEQDAFAQVVINITDNAVKFFDSEQINDANRHRIDFIFRQHPNNKHMIELEIRDYGEGITQQQESKIFELFYRGGNELTRTTQGTGIGLALVNELVLAQQGEIRVERREPGLAMLLSFYLKY
jgi:hypothetical protein